MQSLLEIIKDQAISTHNHCGLSLVQLSKKTGLGFIELKKELKALYDQQEISVRNGINSKLIFKNDSKK
jgi:hypothetical protein